MKFEKTIDRESKQKLYVQIYSIFLEKIESGEWPAATQIPTEDELCRIYDVSKITVREAMQELVRQGYLKRQQGKGTFVTYPIPHNGIVMRTRLSEDDIYGKGVTVKREIREVGVRKASGEIKRFLMIDDDIYYILIEKIVGDEKYSEEFFIPLFVIPDFEDMDISYGSIYNLIEERGAKKIFRVLQKIEIIKLKTDTAAILDLKEGSQVLRISRILLSSDGSPVAFSRLIGKGSKYQLHMEFEKIK